MLMLPLLTVWLAGLSLVKNYHVVAYPFGKIPTNGLNTNNQESEVRSDEVISIGSVNQRIKPQGGIRDEYLRSGRRSRRRRGIDNYLGNMKLKVNKGQLLKYLLVPALITSGLVPYILPPIKMAVMFVTLLTNMAFTSALFTLVRSYIFDPRPEEENVVYHNYGYKNEKKKNEMQKNEMKNENIKPVMEPNYDEKPYRNKDFLIVYPDDENSVMGKHVPIDVRVSAAEKFEKTNIVYKNYGYQQDASTVLPSVDGGLYLKGNNKVGTFDDDIYDMTSISKMDYQKDLGGFGNKIKKNEGGYSENIIRRL